jgi:peptidoglycan/xylan/chitin deacetylase (PgdA/CDA1 family)
MTMHIGRQIVYRLLVLSGLPWLAARLNRRKILVLVYHGVHAGRAEPVLNFDGMHVRARRFARQMRYVSRRYRVVTLDRLLEPGHATPDRPRAVITIDDGYRNIHQVAFPILQRLRLPATLFVPTGFILGGRGFWWDRLRLIVGAAQRPTLPFRIDGTQRVFSIRTLEEQRVALTALSDELRRLPGPRREEALRALATALDVPPAQAGTFAEPLTPAEIRALAEGGVTIGSHGVSHDSYLLLSHDALAHDLTESKSRLEQWTGTRVDWLAYPHGQFSAGVIKAVRRAGYRGAVTTIEALNDERRDPYALRRIGVHDHMTLAHFIVATSGLRDFILGVIAAGTRLWSRAPAPQPRGVA